MQIATRLTVIEAFHNAEAILTYVSMENEVDTQRLIERLLRSGRMVLVPTVSGDTLRWSSIQSLDALEPSPFGIPEPRAGQDGVEDFPADAPVLVPGLVFTREGYRLGYGKAFFDRFLSGHEGLAIGLAFDCQVTKAMPIEPHDRPVDVLVTESGVYECRSIK